MLASIVMVRFIVSLSASPNQNFLILSIYDPFAWEVFIAH